MVHNKIEDRQIFQARLLAALRDLDVPEYGQGVWLADEMGISPKAAGKWIGAESMPQPDKWADLAIKLKKPASYFYEHLDSCNSDTGLSEIDISKRIDDDAFMDLATSTFPNLSDQKRKVLMQALIEQISVPD